VAIMSLQNNSLFYIPSGKQREAASAVAPYFRGTCGDITGFVKIFHALEAERYSANWAAVHYVNIVSARKVSEIRNQLVNILLSNSTSETAATALTSCSDDAAMDEMLARSFIAGFFMNTAVLSADSFTFRMAKGNRQIGGGGGGGNGDASGGAMIHPTSCFHVVMNPNTRQRQQEMMAMMGESGSVESTQRALFRHVDPDTGKPPLVVFGEMRQSRERCFLAYVMSVHREWLAASPDVPARYFKPDELGRAAGDGARSGAGTTAGLRLAAAAREVEDAASSVLDGAERRLRESGF
jgi:hypothetical protein